MKLTEERVVELIDSQITDTQWKPFQTDWTPFWTSMLIVAWLVCGLFHYQIQRASYVVTFTERVDAASNICSLDSRGFVTCPQSNSSIVTPHTQDNWTNSARNGTLFSCLFGPVSLLYDAINVPNDGQKPGW